MFVMLGCGASHVVESRPPRRPDLIRLPRQATLGCSTPVAAPDRELAVELVADQLHTCARTASGAVVCWGRDDGGRLELCPGLEQVGHAATPVRLPFDGATQVAVSEAGTCAIVGGTVQCTSGVHRMLVGDQGPARIGNGELVALAGARRIALGRHHICAIVTDDVVCLSRSRSREVSGARTGLVRDVLGPSPHLARDSEEADYEAGFIPIVRPQLLSAGLAFSCATDRVGAVWCWGRSPFGALGNGPSQTDTRHPTRVGTLTGVVALVSTPDGWDTCARTGEVAYCWGAHFGDQPRQLDLDNVRQLAIGSGYVCALDAARQVSCVGDTANYFKDGVPTFSGPIAQLVSNGSGLCARLTDGAVECFGFAGYLGDGRPLPGGANPGSVVLIQVHTPVRTLGRGAVPGARSRPVPTTVTLGVRASERLRHATAPSPQTRVPRDDARSYRIASTPAPRTTRARSDPPRP